jgi:hypothetical protein
VPSKKVESGLLSREYPTTATFCEEQVIAVAESGKGESTSAPLARLWIATSAVAEILKTEIRGTRRSLEMDVIGFLFGEQDRDLAAKSRLEEMLTEKHREAEVL